MRCDVMDIGNKNWEGTALEQVPVLGFPQLGFGSSPALEELCRAAGGGGEAAAAAGAMPPKPAAVKGGKEKSKADLAKKQKLVEDKTFGLKNKNKSKNVQKFVQSLTQSVQPNPKQTDAKAALKKKKEEESAREKELNELFKVAISQPKVPLGVDPKSIVCEFYRHGQCAKGFKCKFSHDLSVERKGEKIDIYSDQRDGDVDTMDDWDQEKLEKVVESKGMEYSNNKPTEIVCKHFLEAVEKKQYGWFWVCPNGGKDCHYRHALPPGYVLKSQMKALLEEEGEKMSIEEEIEQERSATKSSTPITTELFLQWKREKQAKREAELSAKRAERAKNDRMSGRELFLADASLFVDDAEAFDHYEREEEEIPSSQLSRPAEEAKESGIKDGVSMTQDDEKLLAEDDDELDLDDEELDELEATVSRTSLHDT